MSNPMYYQVLAPTRGFRVYSAHFPGVRMPPMKVEIGPAILTAFDAILDARSPAEFAEDHIPGAISCPVLDDDERAQVGTLYKQTSQFDAKKVGAALVSRNIA